MKRLSMTAVILWMMISSLFGQEVPEGLSFKQFSTAQGLPSSKVHRILQDSDGFIWIASYYGLFRYDGYGVLQLKSNQNTSTRIIHNNVLALCEDSKHRLWIGTEEGLNRLDLLTGQMSSYLMDHVARPRVQHLMMGRDGEVYAGYLRGLYHYDADLDSMVILGGPGYEGDSPDEANCQWILEDADGDLIISTWAQGLYRYIPSQKRFIHYDILDPQGAQIHHQRLLRDTSGNLWLGTYGNGLLRLAFSTDKQQLRVETFLHKNSDPNSLLSDYVLSFVEHPKDHLIWIGTRDGVSIMSLDAMGVPHFTNYCETSTQNFFPEHEVNDVICDNEGMIWLGTGNGGLFHTNLNSSLFHTLYPKELAPFITNSVEGVYVSEKGDIWAGVGYSLAYIHGNEVKSVFDDQVIVQGIFYSSHLDKVLVSIRDKGLYVCSEGKILQRFTERSCSFLPSNNIHHLVEDKEGNWWVATYRGLGVHYADGREIDYRSGLNNELFQSNMVHVTLGVDGTLWISTAAQGVLHVVGNLNDPDQCQVEQYCQENGKLTDNSALFVFVDRDGRIWTGLETDGLCLYNPETDSFENVHKRFNFPGEMVSSMEQDYMGNYWIGTNQSLICFSLKVKVNELNYMHMFSSSDGLPDNYFNPRSSIRQGEQLYFGTNQGLVHFRPESSRFMKREVNCLITDMTLNGTPLSMLPLEKQQEISSNSISHADEVTLSSEFDNFEIHFATLSYNMPQQNRYAYRLVGFDTDWRYVDAGSRIAYYGHLPAGSYTFEVKGSNENGDWSEVRRLQITQLPPWWLSWWAIILYCILVLAIAIYILLAIKNRVMLRNALHVKQMENAKVQELNHVKLQFFSNITHELVTPLTIISASLEELKSLVSGEHELIDTMGVNVNRLMRLLQQILEFRKAETGNLKLRVAEGNIALFLQREVESFIPLIRKKQLDVQVNCQHEVMMGYFDPDKLDKIVYNLLSNASKYTPAGGSIQLDASFVDDHRNVLIVVKDTGKGMTEQQCQGLFKRFYEGDYRQNHTIGTGIGLSLVHDLVSLHQGTIRVESAVNVGTTFSIELPVEAEAYDKEQIIQIEEEQDPTKIIHAEESEIEEVEMPEQESYGEEDDRPKILLVEDNDELRTVMHRLLKREFHVLLATNGVEALQIMHSEDISLVVSDVIMPEMDGMEMTRLAKADVEVCHIPIILLTAKRAEEDRDAGYLAGADAYLTKPFSLAVLQARIHNLLRSREREADSFKNEVAVDIQNLNYTNIDQDFLNRAILCVNNHLGDASFEIVQFAEEMASSRSTLYKKLRSLTNLNPTGFMRNIRLKAACKVMEENPNVRINELAYSVGFNDPKYFSNCFRKEFGMLPTEYCKYFKTENGVEEE